MRQTIEIGISASLFIEFLLITLYSLTQDNISFTLFSFSMMTIGLVFLTVIFIENRFKSKFINDERLDLFTDQAYLLSVLIGFIALIQLAILEFLFEIVINTLTSLTIVIIIIFASFILITFIQSKY